MTDRTAPVIAGWAHGTAPIALDDTVMTLNIGGSFSTVASFVVTA